MSPPWLQILRDGLDLEFGDRPRVAALATVDARRRPRVRHVVVRRLDDDGALHVVSDGRSAKNAHVRDTPAAELALWLPGRREQFRLAGHAAVIAAADDPAAALVFWASLSDAARAMFAWPAPGRPRQEVGGGVPTALPAASPLPESFEILTLRPDEVDYLQLDRTPHLRTRWRADEGWEAREVNP